MAGEQQQPEQPAAPAEGNTADRLDHLETVQAEQGGKLDQILTALQGREQQAHAAAQQHTEHRLDRGTEIEAAMERAIRKVGAEQEHQRQHQQQAAPPPEQPPRQAQGVRSAIQRAMYGEDK